MAVFRTWILNAGGPEEVGRKVGVQGQSVRAWMRRDAVPEARVMVKILRLSGGKVTPTVIVKECYRPAKRAVKKPRGKATK